VGDRVLGDFGLVIGLAEAAADFGGEAALPVGAAGGESAPVQRADERGDLDGFWVGRGEQPGGAEAGLFGAGWDERADPGPPGVPGVEVGEGVGLLVPTVAADQEAGEDGVVGGGRAEAVQQSQVGALRGDDLG
jgi:hypothetical protein